MSEGYKVAQIWCVIDPDGMIHPADGENEAHRLAKEMRECDESQAQDDC